MSPFKNRYAGWSLTLAFIILIYSTIAVAGDLILYLRANNLQRIIAYPTIGIAGLVTVYLIFCILKKRELLDILFVSMSALLYLLSILYLAKGISDKIYLIECSVLTFLFFYALRFDLGKIKSSLLILFLAFITEPGDELIQSRIPSRTFDTKDLAIDPLTAFISLCAIFTIFERK